LQGIQRKCNCKFCLCCSYFITVVNNQ
jgi:hypothetical protein